ncbi:hypothetical protein EPK99_17860 [Neorhizobium lilium]|uniref:Uncharacterized protein n=1 Tax=Neorhizobium lilium TaxID=2503024 RepID=A0A3S3SV79_9HYPH|nr:hypothetical protein [Neorhizobium lilium]RWX75564.1 hypothetical protein EPK99_17860 [Neorhizobium lilium]
MAMVGFKNTNNQIVYINPAQVLYVTTFEPDVSMVAFAVAGQGGGPVHLYVRGNAELVQSKLSVGMTAKA